MKIDAMDLPDKVVLTCLVCGNTGRLNVHGTHLINDDSAWRHVSLVCPCGALISFGCHPGPEGSS